MNTSVTKMNPVENFISEFRVHHDVLSGNEPESIRSIRELAIGSFQKLGIPAKKNEEWKYTNIGSAFRYDYSHLLTRGALTLTAADIKPFPIKGLDAHVAVVENGIFNRHLSSPLQNDGIILCGLSEAMRKFPNLMEKYFSSLSGEISDAFYALNTAFARDGVFLFVPDGKKPDKPIHIINVISGNVPDNLRGDNLFIQPKNIFVIGKKSIARIIESSCPIPRTYADDLRLPSTGSHESPVTTVNSVSELFCGAGSQTEYYQVQDETHAGATFRINTTRIMQETGSSCSAFTITLNSPFIRNNLNLELNGADCNTNLNGLYLLKAEEHLDNHILVEHKKENCNSNELYIGLLDGVSTGVFNGKVRVWKNAMKTNAYQSNRNILLSDNAAINTKPQLEIYADDVKCSHGAVIGRLDDNAMFYLQARGIAEKTAKEMLLQAFAEDVISNIPIDPFKLHVEKLLSEWLFSRNSGDPIPAEAS